MSSEENQPNSAPSNVASTQVSAEETAERRSFKGLSVRIVSGVVYVGLFIGCILAGTIPTALFIALLSGFCAHEFFQMVRRDGKVPNEVIGDVAAVLFPLAALGDSVLLTVVIFLFMLAIGLWYVYTPRARIVDVSATLMGSIYTGFMLSSIVLLRDALPGLAGRLSSPSASARRCGSPTPSPTLWARRLASIRWRRVSALQKTWEGFAGGIAGSVIVWLILVLTGLFTFDALFAILCGALVAVLGVFGDLIESRIKRGAGVKDSGNLIPGHGGMLDRCDSLIFGCITAQLLLYLGGVL